MRIAKIAAAAVAATALVLTGCEASTEQEEALTQDVTNAEATETPAPEETPEPEPTPQVVEASTGDTVTEEEAELLPEGQTGYPLEDGTLVVVDIEEELPQVLVEELDSLLPDEAPAEYEGSGRYAGAGGEALRMADDIALQTGRQIILVGRGGSYDEHNQLDEAFWSHSATGEASEIRTRNIQAAFDSSGTKGSALEFAEWLLGEVEDPDSYQIIVRGEA